jgi:putative tributyrin esterase
MFKTLAKALLIAILLCLPVGAQQAGTASDARLIAGAVYTESLDSKLMGRKMPYNVILPSDYFSGAESGRRYPVLFLLHGLMGRFDNWASKTDIAKRSEDHSLIIVMPEGENGWYTDNLTKNGASYESYIIKELIPEIDKRYRTLNSRDSRAVAGLSMGGYGAIKFGLKYPDMFALVGSFSGALSAATITEKQVPGAIGKSITAIFGPEGTEVRKANDPFDLARRAPADKIAKLPFIYLDCGTEDFLFQSNRDFVSLLLEKKVPHEFRQLPGAHNWTYWGKQIDEFLEVSDQYLNFK